MTATAHTQIIVNMCKDFFRAILCFLVQGLGVIHHKTLIQVGLLVLFVTAVFAAYFNYLVFQIDPDIQFYFQKVDILYSNYFRGVYRFFFLLLVGPKEWGYLIYHNETASAICRLILKSSMWWALDILLIFHAAYAGLIFRRATNRLPEGTENMWREFGLLLKGCAFIITLWFLILIMIGYVIDFVIFWHGLYDKFYDFLPFLVVGVVKVSLNLFVYFNSLNLKISWGFKSIEKFWANFGFGDIVTVAAFAVVYIVLGGISFISALGILFGISYLGAKYISLNLACFAFNTFLLWALVNLNGITSYCFGLFYRYNWNQEFRDPTIKFAPFPSRGKKIQRWRNDMVAPPIVLENGNLHQAPSPVEAMAAAHKKQHAGALTTDGATSAEPNTPGQQAPEQNQNTGPEQPMSISLSSNPSLSAAPQNVEKEPAKPAWTEEIKEVEMEVPPPPPPKPQDEIKPKPLPNIKFKW